MASISVVVDSGCKDKGRNRLWKKRARNTKVRNQIFGAKDGAPQRRDMTKEELLVMLDNIHRRHAAQFGVCRLAPLNIDCFLPLKCTGGARQTLLEYACLSPGNTDQIMLALMRAGVDPSLRNDEGEDVRAPGAIVTMRSLPEQYAVWITRRLINWRTHNLESNPTTCAVNSCTLPGRLLHCGCVLCERCLWTDSIQQHATMHTAPTCPECRGKIFSEDSDSDEESDRKLRKKSSRHQLQFDVIEAARKLESDAEVVLSHLSSLRVQHCQPPLYYYCNIVCSPVLCRLCTYASAPPTSQRTSDPSRPCGKEVLYASSFLHP